MMNSLHRFILGTAAITGLVLLMPNTTTTQPVQAATWHHGTPKIVRGYWKHDDSIVTITSKSFTQERLGWPATKFTKLRYQKVNATTYKLKGTYHNGNLATKNSHLKLVKKGSQLKFKYSWASRFQYLGWYQH
ncbi:hypothetical protein [Lactobacillus brevis ATCC 367] [Lactiplantibacillus mudanjiangensis]|nr:hypothetical protein [Lactobacillus brevis ATCC 367] [Lactiplantibacillus mudanjiangensis]